MKLNDRKNIYFNIKVIVYRLIFLYFNFEIFGIVFFVKSNNWGRYIYVLLILIIEIKDYYIMDSKV